MSLCTFFSAGCVKTRANWEAPALCGTGCRRHRGTRSLITLCLCAEHAADHLLRCAFLRATKAGSFGVRACCSDITLEAFLRLLHRVRHLPGPGRVPAACCEPTPTCLIAVMRAAISTSLSAESRLETYFRHDLSDLDRSHLFGIHSLSVAHCVAWFFAYVTCPSWDVYGDCLRFCQRPNPFVAIKRLLCWFFFLFQGHQLRAERKRHSSWKSPVAHLDCQDVEKSERSSPLSGTSEGNDCLQVLFSLTRRHWDTRVGTSSTWGASQHPYCCVLGLSWRFGLRCICPLPGLCALLELVPHRWCVPRPELRGIRAVCSAFCSSAHESPYMALLIDPLTVRAVHRSATAQFSSPCFVAHVAADPEFFQSDCALLLRPTALGVALDSAFLSSPLCTSPSNNRHRHRQRMARDRSPLRAPSRLCQRCDVPRYHASRAGHC